MILNQFSLKNNRLNFDHIDIDLSAYGIHVITGTNGVGKTSLIEKLVYERNENIVLTHDEQQDAYLSRRHELIAYVPQNMMTPDIKVAAYIKKQKEIDEQKIIRLLEQFDLDRKILNARFPSLSGGERVKISIITALLKETPYVFLDEPTNNLDDSSVSQLVTCIEKLADERTFIIVTHDPRMKFEKANRIQMEKKGVSQENHLLNEQIKNNKKTTTATFNPFKIATQLLFYKSMYLFLFIVIFALATLSMFNNDHFEQHIASWELPLEDIILTFPDFGVVSAFTERYANHVGLRIDENKHERIIYYDDISDIFNLVPVEKIIIEDHEQIFRTFSNDALLENVLVLNPPEILWTSYARNISPLLNPQFLQSGRFPQDNKREVTLSATLLQSYFDFTPEMIENPLGEIILLNGKGYEVVGTYYANVAIVSYHADENYGFYTFDENNIQYFISDMIAFKNTLNNPPEESYKAMNLLIVTAPGYEQVVLNELIKMYPAQGFSSHAFDDAWLASYNQEVVNRVLFRNILISIGIGAIIVVIYMENQKQLFPLLKDFEAHYLDRKQIRYAYLFLIGISYVICLIILLKVNQLLNSYQHLNIFILMVNVLIVMGMSLTFLMIKMTKDAREGK
ncbi:MAG: ATP-binding cassette domain-containing protein [Defluviitaleaceae bacterium]|nr:ATP-binding cassette domain-containing protein [Defluviitaleaceae bacterium]